MLESLFNKVEGLDTFFYRTPPVAASDKDYKISDLFVMRQNAYWHIELKNEIHCLLVDK